jgi:hypothetical protein
MFLFNKKKMKGTQVSFKNKKINRFFFPSNFSSVKNKLKINVLLKTITATTTKK